MTVVYEHVGFEGHTTARPIRVPVARTRPATLRLGLAAFLLGCWISGACVGIVYWALNASLLGVILSAAVPGLGAAWVLPLFQGVEAASDLRNE